MFSESYHETFSSLGVRLLMEHACSSADIENAERRLEIKLPASLRDYYLIAGREGRINQFHNRLLPPEKLFIESGHLVFMEENQWVVYWGVPTDKNQEPDAAVFQGVNLGKKGIEWHQECDSCFMFLNVMAVWHASFGGAAAHSAVGYVNERKTRKILDEQWQFLGQVNAMRAYKQASSAVCFLKWEDFLQKTRNLPSWRVFAAAGNERALKESQASVPAQWERWGD